MAYTVTQLQSAIDSTPWPGKGLCLKWVTDVFINLGMDVTRYGTARAAKAAWCHTPISQIKPGMVIAWNGPTSTHAGHIAIYIDDNHVYDSETYGIRCHTLSGILSGFGVQGYNNPTCGWVMGQKINDKGHRGGSFYLPILWGCQ